MRTSIFKVDFNLKEDVDLTGFDNQKALDVEQQTLPNVIIANTYEQAFYIVKDLKLKFFELGNLENKLEKVIIKGELKNEEV